MRAVAIAVLVVLGGRLARADDPVAEVRAPSTAAGDHAAVQVAIGAGSEDGATALGEVRAGWRRRGVAIELGARVRWRAGDLVRADWDSAGDWLGVVRRLEVAHRGARVAAVAGAGRLAPVGQGALVEGYSTAAVIDRRAPGAIARLRTPRLALDAVIDDVTAPSLVAGGGELALPGRWRAAIGVAIDPGRDVMDRRAQGAIELGARWSAGPLGLGGVVVAGGRGAIAAMARGDASARRGRLRAAARLEARAYTGDEVAAPYGPLTPIERERMATTDGAGVATAVSAAIAVDGVGELSAGVRTRGARGDLVTARVALPWWRVVQAGAYAAVGLDDAIAAGEARIVWTPRWFSAIEAGRGYRRDDSGELGGVWQVTAWFGAATGW